MIHNNSCRCVSFTRKIVCLLALLHTGFPVKASSETELLVRSALAAEQRFDTRGALELLLRAEKAGRSDGFVLQKISRQYTDLIADLGTEAEQRDAAHRAVEYAKRAAALEPHNPLHAVSIAISYGKLALASGASDKVRYSRFVRQYAEQALAMDPNYAWAHHVLGRWHLEVAQLGGASRFAVKLFLGGLPPASIHDAVLHLERAAALEPNETLHAIELGFALLAAGDSTRARHALERGLALPSRARIDEPAKERARAALTNLTK